MGRPNIPLDGICLTVCYDENTLIYHDGLLILTFKSL